LRILDQLSWSSPSTAHFGEGFQQNTYKLFLRFGHSFTQQQRFGGLKTQKNSNKDRFDVYAYCVQSIGA